MGIQTNVTPPKSYVIDTRWKKAMGEPQNYLEKEAQKELATDFLS